MRNTSRDLYLYFPTAIAFADPEFPKECIFKDFRPDLGEGHFKDFRPTLERVIHAAYENRALRIVQNPFAPPLTACVFPKREKRTPRFDTRRNNKKGKLPQNGNLPLFRIEKTHATESDTLLLRVS